MNHHKVALTLSKNTKATTSRNAIAGELGLQEHEISEIGERAKTHYDFFVVMLSSWKSSFSTGANLDKLVSVLNNLNMKGLADELKMPKCPENGEDAFALAKYVFGKCSSTIKANLAASSVVFTLHCKKVLTQEEYEEILDLKTVTKRQMLITAMMKKDKKNVQAFIDVLKSETAGQEYIYEELERAVLDFESQQSI